MARSSDRLGRAGTILLFLAAFSLPFAAFPPCVLVGVQGPFLAGTAQGTGNGTGNDTTFKSDPNYVNATLKIETDYGTIVGMLYEADAPITTANFIKLASEGFYDGCTFHRVVDDFVIQGGDPLSKDDNPYNDGTGGSDETIPLEINANLTHIDGAFGMARSSEPDSASSQFYICDGPQNGLDGDYAVFAVTVEGLDVVQKISAVQTWGYMRPLIKDQPREDVIMKRVTVTAGFLNSTSAPANSTTDGGEEGLLSRDSADAIFAIVIALACGVGCLVAFKMRKVKKEVEMPDDAVRP